MIIILLLFLPQHYFLPTLRLLPTTQPQQPQPQQRPITTIQTPMVTTATAMPIHQTSSMMTIDLLKCCQTPKQTKQTPTTAQPTNKPNQPRPNQQCSQSISYSPFNPHITFQLYIITFQSHRCIALFFG